MIACTCTAGGSSSFVHSFRAIIAFRALAQAWIMKLCTKSFTILISCATSWIYLPFLSCRPLMWGGKVRLLLPLFSTKCWIRRGLGGGVFGRLRQLWTTNRRKGRSRQFGPAMVTWIHCLGSRGTFLGRTWCAGSTILAL